MAETAQEPARKAEPNLNTLLPPALAAYTDFRQYLKDVYEYKRQTLSTAIRPYTYAVFSASADIKSPNYLRMIIEGQRNLSDNMIGKFSKALGHSKAEAEEFAALVHFGQAREPLERNRYLKVLADIRVQQQIKAGEIKTESWNKVPNWITWVLYALADQEGINFNIDTLHRALKGRAKREEIKKYLTRLLESGELIKDPETGEIRKGRLLMQGSEDVPVALVRKLQAELIYLGLESLFQEDATEREFGGFTIALTEAEFEHMKYELRQLRKRLYKDALVNRERSKGDKVYQLNIQLFPITEKTK